MIANGNQYDRDFTITKSGSNFSDVWTEIHKRELMETGELRKPERILDIFTFYFKYEEEFAHGVLRSRFAPVFIQFYNKKWVTEKAFTQNLKFPTSTAGSKILTNQ